MIYIGCTQKLAKEFKDRPVARDATVCSGIHGWHANIYSFFRHKSVVAVNDETRLCIFLPGLRKPEFKDFENLFRTRLKEELLRFGISKGEAAELLLSLGPMTIGRTHNRSVLGTMNDMAFSLKIQLERLGRLPEDDEERGGLSQIINRTPCRAKGRSGYFFPADEIKRFCPDFEIPSAII